MEEALLSFAKQFAYEPVISNGDVQPTNFFSLCGMGGSHLAARLIRGYDRSISLHVRNDYGLPEISDEETQKTLFIASSYSGNTEEVVSFMEMAIQEKLNLVAIATGGRLIHLAKENNIPYVELPDTGIQPRTAVGYSLLALLKVMGRDILIKEVQRLQNVLKPAELQDEGKQLAHTLAGSIPVIYSSTRNRSVAYNWKIKFNETAKIPAFYNVFPELNHNEMAGFDVIDSTHGLSENIRFIFLRDRLDNSHIQKRMDVCEELLQERGFEVISKELVGDSYFEKVFRSTLVADWTALALSEQYGTEPEAVEIIEQFKKRL